MISRLIVRNFQRHKHLDLKLGRITTIVGPNNAGKSTLMRAIGWAAIAMFRGDFFIRHGAKTTSVTLHVGKHVIKRCKGKKNAYYLNGQKLAAFGTKVPDEVVAILNMGELNFQRQITLPFWFSESAGIVSKHLNKIVDLSVIDDTLKNLNQTTGKRKSETEVVEQRYLEAKAERNRLKWSAEAHTDLEFVEKLEKKSKTHAIRARTLQELLAQATIHHKRMDQLTSVLLQGQTVLQAGTKAEKIEKKLNRLNYLLINAEAWSKDTQKPEWPTELEHDDQNIANMQEQREHLEQLLQTIKHDENTIKAAKTEVWIRKAELEEFEICPLCERRM